MKQWEPKNYSTEEKIQISVLYSGKQGHQLLSKIKKAIKKTWPDDRSNKWLATKVQSCVPNFP